MAIAVADKFVDGIMAAATVFTANGYLMFMHYCQRCC